MSIKQYLKKNPVWIIFNLVWFIALAHIVYYGLKPYPHYITGELKTADFSSITLVCAYVSLYFIVGNIMKLIKAWNKYPYWAYVFLSTVLVFQGFIAVVSAMHAPPYIAAFIINCMFLLLLHFVFYPIYAISRKYMKPQKN